MNILNPVFKIFTWAFRLAYLAVGLIIIFAVFYIFGNQYLTAGPVVGNDIPNAYIYIQWLDYYWPHIPLWWPEQGGGVSFVYGHQIGSYFIIIFLHKVIGLSLVQGMRLLGFLSILLTSTGIYFFTWIKTKSQTAAFLAGLFYLFSDVMWRWLTDIGLYTQAVSLMFVPPVLIFFDLFLSAHKDKQNTKKRIFLFLTALFYALLVFTHIVSGVLILIVLPLYALFYFQLVKWDRSRILRLLEGIKTGALAGLSGIFLLAFWIFPYTRYFREADRDHVNLAALHQIPYFTLPQVFGYFTEEDFLKNMWLICLELGVGLLFFIGFFIAAFRKKSSLFAWGLVALTFFLVMISPSVNPVFMKIFYYYFAMIGVRGILLVSILFPILAGYATVAISGLILDGLAWSFNRLSLKLTSGAKFVLKQIGNTAIFIAALAIGFIFVYSFRIPAEGKRCGEYYIGIGPSSSYGYCLFLHAFLTGKEKLPPISLNTQGLQNDQSAREIVSAVDPGINSRVDITPSLGSLMQRWNIFTHTSQVSLYAYGLSLIRAMWGYQQGLFYGPEPSRPEQIVEAAKWFGIQRLILKDDTDNLGNYPEEYWTKIYEEPTTLEFREKVNLVEASSRPTILVIGDHELRSYEQIFKLGNQGAFPYNDFFLVEGESKFVDKYSASELASFDGLILFSYDFKNRKKAEKLLTEYVSKGGNLWIETGWQYTSPDWKQEKTAVYIPLKSQDWIDLGVTSNYELNKEIIPNIDEKLFFPLEWENRGWGFSSAKDSLKDWAKPVLSVSDYPLIVVGQYGQGKVVWSGMNLFAHAYDKENREEVKLLRSLASWLLTDLVPKEGAVAYSRDNPDEMNFVLQSPAKWLLWKESYSPYWRARGKTKEGKTFPLKFYRAGPGWVLIYLPSNYSQEGVVVSLRYVQSWAGYLGYVVSSLTLIGFLLYLFGVERRVLGKIKLKVIPSKMIAQKIRNWWESEVE